MNIWRTCGGSFDRRVGDNSGTPCVLFSTESLNRPLRAYNSKASSPELDPSRVPPARLLSLSPSLSTCPLPPIPRRYPQPDFSSAADSPPARAAAATNARTPPAAHQQQQATKAAVPPPSTAGDGGSGGGGGGGGGPPQWQLSQHQPHPGAYEEQVQPSPQQPSASAATRQAADGYHHDPSAAAGYCAEDDAGADAEFARGGEFVPVPSDSE